MAGLDRRSRLLSDHSVVGIDYLYVDPANQTDLDVHFIFPPSVAQQALLTADRVTITATAGDAPPVRVAGVDFPVVNGAAVMRIRTAAPGGFTNYTLTLANPSGGSPVLDPYLARVSFSFKAGCYSDIDCDHSPAPCPPADEVDFPIDYTARDFWSLRSALLGFASQRYPNWADRLEADAAVMLAEVMAAVGDEMAYSQDRVARESHLETATQRRSLRRHARMVDYRIHDGLGATTTIWVSAKAAGTLKAGMALYALRDGRRIAYSVGRNLAEMTAAVPVSYAIDPALNDDKLIPYQWDARDLCLPAGATELFLKGDVVNAIKPAGVAERWLLLRTDPLNSALPARRQLVRVISAEVVHDPLANVDTTCIVWDAAQKLPCGFDLTVLKVSGNIIPAVAGALMDQEFLIGPGNELIPAPDQNPPWAVERQGPNGTVAFIHSLPGTDTDGLIRRSVESAPGDPRQAEPELLLVERLPNGVGGWQDGQIWRWRASLLDSPAAQAQDCKFMLDDGIWRRVVGYRRAEGEFEHVDYASGDGVSIRFGDGDFGLIPARGTRFRARWLAGNGRRANLPADAVTGFDPAVSALVSAVSNPLAIDNGIDPETPDQVRQLAPEAFRSLTFRAVRPEDYAEAAERLPWVQRAGCAFRWTGSWQTAFVTPDPLGGVEITTAERGNLEAQLNRFRQVGRETHALDPRYADLDLQIAFCVEHDAYASEVKLAVGAALTGSGFFAADNFSFGTPLDRSRLEAAIQSVPGVRAVEQITFRRRGFFDWRDLPTGSFQPALSEVIRVENDLLHPDRGSIKLLPEGGA
jgi:hypothetical protein